MELDAEAVATVPTEGVLVAGQVLVLHLLLLLLGEGVRVRPRGPQRQPVVRLSLIHI